jgi:hypothetical protein
VTWKEQREAVAKIQGLVRQSDAKIARLRRVLQSRGITQSQDAVMRDLERLSDERYLMMRDLEALARAGRLTKEAR